MQSKLGGKLHLKLNNGKKPIANKYREGKMKRTLKRELNRPEIAAREAIKTSKKSADIYRISVHPRAGARVQ